MKSRLFSLSDAAAPDAAVEIGSRGVAAAIIERRGGRPVVQAYALEPLAEGALVPSLTARNLKERPAVEAALARVLEHVGRPRRIGVVIPDPAARVSLVRFEQVPARAQDLDQLIRWQVRKAAPFPLEEAQVSYVHAGDPERVAPPAAGGAGLAEARGAGLSGPPGHEFIVTVARRDVVEEYETLVAARGAHAGIVDISTFGVINAALAGGAAPAGDWLLVNVAADWASIAILRGPRLIFFRTRSADADGTLTDLVHQTAMYYEDRLQGGGFGRAVLCGGSSEGVGRSLEERLAIPVASIDLRAAAALTDRITAPPALLDALTPAAGLLLRDREAAA
jgi:Tfp pilus assembly PilM family ATPase